jgi:hypothetical protein
MFPVVYCMHGWQWLWRYTLTSIKSLMRFGFTKDQIYVFYAPPRFPEHLKWLNKNATVFQVDTPLHDPESLSLRVWHEDYFYGSTMKIHAFTVPEEGIFWMDSDTEVHNNIYDMLELDYDVLVGSSNGWEYMKKPSAEAGYPDPGRLYYGGFWATKNYAHRKMHDYYVDYWERLFTGEFTVGSKFRLELYAWNLALLRFQHDDGANIVQMPGHWQGYSRILYVCHLKRNFFSPRERHWLNQDELDIITIGADETEWMSH